jgi:hypothetical protein
MLVCCQPLFSPVLVKLFARRPHVPILVGVPETVCVVELVLLNVQSFQEVQDPLGG